MIEVSNNLCFISDRGIEVFNGVECYTKPLSEKIDRTISTIDTGKYDYIVSTVHRDKYEVWFSIPDRTSGSAITIVYNYVYDKFYYFSFYKTPSCFAFCENSDKKLVTKMGTRDGYLCLCETTYRDNTTAITATRKTGWMGGGNNKNIRRVDTYYELPASMTLTLNAYVEFDKDVQRTAALTGVTPSATDIEHRRVVKDVTELGLRGEWYALEYVNAENVGGDLRLNGMAVYLAEREPGNKTSGD